MSRKCSYQKCSRVYSSMCKHSADIALPSDLPRPCTVRHLVTHYLDFQSIPRRSFFELLSYFATESELEREKLEEFTTAEGQVSVSLVSQATP